MNVSDFIAAFRSDLADQAMPEPLWSDADIVRYLNDAVQEANERALLTEDRATPSVCSIAVVAGTATYALHPAVLQIKRAKLDGRIITETSVEEQDACGPSDWETRSGRAREYIFQPATGTSPATMQLVRVPTEAGVLALTVYRGALKKLSADINTGKPEIPERYHERLKDWVYRCAYLKQDADAFDKSKAIEFEASFERSFGARPDANVQRKQRDKRPPLVRSNW